ncbi:MAG: heavy metal-binding domain-containing protein [Bacteroidia bacterium]
MTKKSIIQSLAIVISIIVLQACNQTDNAAQKEKSDEPIVEIAHADYQCPMDCEKGKVYHQPGKCPVCGRDLAKVEHKENEKHEHGIIGADTSHDTKHQHKEGDGHNYDSESKDENAHPHDSTKYESHSGHDHAADDTIHDKHEGHNH